LGGACQFIRGHTPALNRAALSGPRLSQLKALQFACLKKPPTVMDSITYFVLSREARVYDGGVGTGRPRLDEVQGRSASLALHSGSTAPTMPVLPVALFGALRQSRRPLLIFPGGFAVNITGVCHGHSKRLR
jgi:hypothetical protein